MPIFPRPGSCVQQSDAGCRAGERLKCAARPFNRGKTIERARRPRSSCKSRGVVQGANPGRVDRQDNMWITEQCAYVIVEESV
jgi:hypothetical protein